MYETEPLYNNNTFFMNNFPTGRDRNPTTVSENKTWKKVGSVYRCLNCGYIPTFVSIVDLRKCPKCEILKTFYETDDGLKPIFTDD